MEEMILSALTGSLAGYLTNDIAIKMLFNKYFGLGGIVVKTRDDFEKEVSKLIEQEVINHNTINKHIKNKRFAKVLEKSIFDSIAHFNNSLKGDFGKVLEQELKNNQKEIKNGLKGYLESFFKPLILEEFIAEERLDMFFGELLEKLAKIIEEEGFLDEIINNLNSVTLEELVTPRVLENVFGKLITLQNKCQSSEELREEASKLIVNLDVEGVLISVIDKVLNLKIEDILSLSQKEHLQKYIERGLLVFLRENKDVLISLIESFFSAIEQRDYIKFIPKEKSPLQEEVNKIIPEVRLSIVNYLQEKEKDFDEGLNEAITEVVQSTDSVKKILLEEVQKKYLTNVFVNYKITEKISEHINNQMDTDEITDRFIEPALKKLEEADLQNDKEVRKRLHEYLITSLNNLESKGVDDALTSINQNNISGLLEAVGVNLNEQKEKMILTAKEHLKSYLLLENLKLEDLFKKAKQPMNLKVEENDRKYILEKSLYLLKNNFFDNIAKLEIMKLFPLEEFIDSNLTTFIEGDKELKTSWSKEISAGIQSNLDKNLEPLLRGRIELLVAQNISSLSNENLNEMMKNFMGKELKAINILGALIGAGAGLTTAKLSGSLLMSIPVYSLIGYITNSLAVTMLFRPYNNILGIQGVVPRQKPEFARSIAKLIEKNFLNEETLYNYLEENKVELLAGLKNILEQGEYEKVKRTIIGYDREIKEGIVTNIKDYIQNNNMEELTVATLRKIATSEVADEVTGKVDSELKKYKQKVEESLEVKINDIKEKQIIDQKQQIEKFITSQTTQKIYSKLEEGSFLERVKLPTEKLKLDKEKLITIFSINTVRVMKKVFDQERSLIEIAGYKNNKNNFTMAIIDYAENILLKELDREKGKIIELLSGVIKSKLNFVENIGYKLADGDSVLEKIVTIFISDKLPKILALEDKAKDNLEKSLRETLAVLNVGSLGVKIDYLALEVDLKKYLSSTILESKMSFLVGNFNTRINIDELMGQMSIKTGKDIFQELRPHLENEFLIIKERLNNSPVKEYLNVLLFDNLENIVKDMLEEISSDELIEVFKRTIKVSEAEKKVLDLTEIIIRDGKGTEFIVDSKVFKRDLNSKNIKLTLDEKENELYNQNTKRELINLVNNIDVKLIEVVLEGVANSMYAGFEDNFKWLLASLNLNKVAIEEIEGMENQKIQEVFQVIAGRYFKKIKLYGLGGGIFGINNYLGIGLATLVYGYEKQVDKKNKTKTIKKDGKNGGASKKE